jgi:hypothetical protein
MKKKIIPLYFGIITIYGHAYVIRLEPAPL